MGDNVAEDTVGFFEKEVAKEKSIMIDPSEIEAITTNLKRLKALKLYQSGQASAAAKIQREIILSHE